MRKRVLITGVLAAAVVGFCTAHAGAIPIHQHYKVQHTHQRVIPTGDGKRLTKWKTTETRTRIVNVAPADADDDGIPDSVDPCIGYCPPPTPAPAPPTTSSPVATSTLAPTTTTATGGWGDVPGVPASFAACVAMAESTNGTNPAAGGNVYGILDPVPGTDPVGDPKGAMAALYAQSGAAAWSPYDGC